jgi:hypothetical protein
VKLSEKTMQWLTDSHCFEEITDDMVTLAESGIQILLSQKAVQDLNRQAREQEFS